jgi:hypothetical protein
VSARRWMLAAAVLVSCAVPALDRTGAIRCGTADGGLGLCPDGFECRLDRCCPTDSPTGTCPSIPASTSGAPCTAPACATGTAVTACCATVNAVGARVLPGGYTTTTNCTSNGQCGEFGACEGGAGFDRTVCLRRCTYRAGRVTPCRDAPAELAAASSGSYVCVPDPEGRASSDGICVPDCTAVPALCGSAAQCNPTTHTCGNCNTNPAMCTGATICNRATGECARCAPLINPCPAGTMCNVGSGRCR